MIEEFDENKKESQEFDERTKKSNFKVQIQILKLHFSHQNTAIKLLHMPIWDNDCHFHSYNLSMLLANSKFLHYNKSKKKKSKSKLEETPCKWVQK